MVVLIAIIILIIGLIGIGVILVRKIPVLAELVPEEIEEIGTLRKLRYKFSQNGTLKSFSGEALLQNMLSKIKILTSKTDSKTNTWLEKSRKRSIEKKNDFSDDYWQKIKDEK